MHIWTPLPRLYYSLQLYHHIRRPLSQYFLFSAAKHFVSSGPETFTSQVVRLGLVRVILQHFFNILDCLAWCADLYASESSCFFDLHELYAGHSSGNLCYHQHHLVFLW